MFRNCFELKSYLSKAEIQTICCSRFDGRYRLSLVDWKVDITLSLSKWTKVVLMQQGLTDPRVYHIDSVGAVQLKSFLDLKITQIMS